MRQLIKQSDGLYAEYCSNDNALISCNHTRESYVNKQIEKFKRHLNNIIDMVDEGKPITKHAVSFEEALDLTKQNRPERYKEMIEIINS